MWICVKLFVNKSYTKFINHLPREESDTILESIFEYIENYEYLRFKWKPNDVLIYDNCSLQHKATTLEVN